MRSSSRRLAVAEVGRWMVYGGSSGGTSARPQSSASSQRPLHDPHCRAHPHDGVERGGEPPAGWRHRPRVMECTAHDSTRRAVLTHKVRPRQRTVVTLSRSGRASPVRVQRRYEFGCAQFVAGRRAPPVCCLPWATGYGAAVSRIRWKSVSQIHGPGAVIPGNISADYGRRSALLCRGVSPGRFGSFSVHRRTRCLHRPCSQRVGVMTEVSCRLRGTTAACTSSSASRQSSESWGEFAHLVAGPSPDSAGLRPRRPSDCRPQVVSVLEGKALDDEGAGVPAGGSRRPRRPTPGRRVQPTPGNVVRTSRPRCASRWASSSRAGGGRMMPRRPASPRPLPEQFVSSSDDWLMSRFAAFRTASY